MRALRASAMLVAALALAVALALARPAPLGAQDGALPDEPGIVLAQAAPAPEPEPREQGEPGFVQLAVNGQQTAAFFQTWFDDEGTPFLHFDALMRAVEIPTSYDPALGSALGFLADGRTRFLLNLEQGTVVIGGETQPLDEADVRVIEQELYVRHTALAAWLPLEIEWSVAAFEIRVFTDYTLPSVERLRREQEREELARRRAAEEDFAALEREVPWFDPGMFELGTTARGGEGFPEEGRLNLKGVHRFLKGDLEYSLTESYVNGERQAPNVDYARLRYYDPQHTWEAALGDTFTSFSPLVLDTVSFRGGSFYTGGRPLRYGRTTLIGTAPPGSEVDLYRLGVLVDFTTAGDDGFYRFQNVPLTARSTLFEVHIFTPQGRRRVEFQRVSSSEAMLPRHAVASQGAAGEGRDELNPFRLAGGEVRYGLFPRLTLGTYALRVEDFDAGFETIDEHQSGALLALWRPVSWLLVQAERAQDTVSGDSGTRLDAFVSLGVASLELEQRTYEADYAPPARERTTDFSEPERADSVATAELRTRLLDTNLALRSRRSDYGDARERTEHRLRLDRRLLERLSVLLTVERERHTEPGFPEGGLDGQELLATWRLGTLTRLEGLYERTDVIGSDTFTRWRATWLKNQQFASPWAYRVSYIASSSEENYSEASLGYLFANNLRLSGQADTQGRWLLQLDYTLPFRVDSRGVEPLAPNMFGRAGAEGYVYLDENGDGARQPAEPTLPGVEVLAPGTSGLATGEDGRYRGWGLPARDPSALSVNLLTTDALYLPAQDRYPVAPRPGEMLQRDIALVPAGGLEGRVRDSAGGAVSPAQGLELELRDASGEVVARSRVEWDGAFVLENIPPGTYHLSADEAALERLGVRLEPASREIVFPPGAEPAWLTGVTFTVHAAE